MAKIESFLRKYSWLLKLGVFVLLIVWAIKIHNGVSYVISSGKEYTGKYDFQVNMKICNEMTVFINELYEKNKTSAVYSPSNHFEDLKKVIMKERELRQKYEYASPVKHTGLEYSDVQPLRILVDERRSRVDYWDEMQVAAKAFQDWQVQKGFRENIDLEKNKKELSGWARRTLWPWVLGLYFKGLFLCLILYLTRMAQNDGILKTILADKMKFFLSIVMWPRFILDYPSHIIREIHVEAELRRLGDKFRKLSPLEKKIVREVAIRSREEYRAWIKSFRKANSGKFQRGVLGCVFVVFILAIFLPVAPAFSIDHAAGTKSFTSCCDPPIDHESPENVLCLPEFWEISQLREISLLILEEISIVIWLFSREIDCIPDFGCKVGENSLQTS